MKYEIERLKGQVKIKFAVEPVEWEDHVNKVYLKTKNKYNVQGFRRGHATRKMIEMNYGAAVFFDDAFTDCVNEYYDKALDENEDIFPVEQPHIDIEKFDGKSLSFIALVTVKPEVKLGAYSGLEIPCIKPSVTQKEVNSELDRVRENASRKVEVTDREVKNGDIVNLDYCGKVDDVAFDGGTAANQELVIGSGTFIPGFEEQMIGMKLGETRDLNVKFPDDYRAENLAGKNAVFTVTVNKIMVKELPELDDVFASNVSKFETLKEYKEDIKNKILTDKETKAKVANENNLIDAVVKNAEVEIPECMIKTQLDYILEDLKYRISMYRMKLDDYFKYIGTDEEAFLKERRPEAESAVKTRLVIEQIIKENNIEITDDDFKKKVASLAEQSKKSSEEFEKDLNENQRDYIKREALMDKVILFLESKNKYIVKDNETKSSETGESDNTPVKAKRTTAKKSEPVEEVEKEQLKAKRTTAKKSEPVEEVEKEQLKAKRTTAKKSESVEETEKEQPKAKRTTAKKSESVEEAGKEQPKTKHTTAKKNSEKSSEE